MQVSLEQLEPCKVQLNIEVEPERVATAVETVYGELSKRTAVPGFRKGKAPRQLLERYLSPETVRQRTIEHVIGPAYIEALKETGVDPYTEPDVEVVQFEDDQPFIFKAAVQLAPKVELGDYKGIEVERKVQEITDKDVEEQVEHLRQNHAKSKKVEDRGAQKGDILIADIASAPEGEDKPASRRTMVEVGANIPAFDENITGMNAGESKTFQLPYPEDFENKELAGKTLEFEITVQSINEREVPELNDEFAKTECNSDTVEDLLKGLRQQMTMAAEEEAEREVERKIVDEVVSRAKIDFPEVLVHHEMEHDLADLQSRVEKQGLTIENYLKRLDVTKEKFLEELKEQASNRVRTGLALGEIISAEKIEVTDEEIEAEIDRMAAESSSPRESVVMFIEARGGRQMLRNRLLNRKLMDFLKSVSAIK